MSTHTATACCPNQCSSGQWGKKKKGCGSLRWLWICCGIRAATANKPNCEHRRERKERKKERKGPHTQSQKETEKKHKPLDYFVGLHLPFG